MKRILLAVFVIVATWAVVAQAQDPPPPPTSVSGGVQQVTGFTTGDTANGASSVSSTSALFTGTASAPGHLSGVANVAGYASATNTTSATGSQSAFGSTGTADARVKLGRDGTGGSITIAGTVGGMAVGNVGDCSTGICAGGLSVGNAGANYSKTTDGGGRLGASLSLVTEGYTWSNLSPTSSSAGAHVSAEAQVQKGKGH